MTECSHKFDHQTKRENHYRPPGKVMFSEACVSHYVHGEGTRGCHFLSLVPWSIAGGVWSVIWPILVEGCGPYQVGCGLSQEGWDHPEGCMVCLGVVVFPMAPYPTLPPTLPPHSLNRDPWKEHETRQEVTLYTTLTLTSSGSHCSSQYILECILVL